MAGPGPDQAEFFPGSGHAHIAKAPLLIEFFFRIQGTGVGKQPLLHAHHKDCGKFQSLGAVQGYQGCSFRPCRHTVHISHQGNLFQKEAQIAPNPAVEFFRYRQQFLEVFQSALGLYAFLGIESSHIAGLMHNLLESNSDGRFTGDSVQVGQHVRELTQTGSGPAANILGGSGQAGHGRHASILGIGQQPADSAFANAPPGFIDDSGQADPVQGVGQDFQIGQHVFDFLAPVEREPANELVGQSCFYKCIFQSPGLGPSAKEDGVVPKGPSTASDLPDDKISLIPFIPGIINLDLFPLAGGSPQFLDFAPAVVGNDGIGGPQNIAGGAVVLLQFDYFRFGIVLFKIQDIAYIGPTKEVD